MTNKTNPILSKKNIIQQIRWQKNTKDTFRMF